MHNITTFANFYSEYDMRVIWNQKHLIHIKGVGKVM